MKKSDFYYDLPKELIAQTPIEPRDHSRMMVLSRDNSTIEHKHFYDFIDFLNPGDCLILNNTRVLPARIYGIKKETGAVVEFLLLNNLGNDCWETITGPGKRAKIGAEFTFGDGILSCRIEQVLENGNRIIRFSYDKKDNILVKDAMNKFVFMNSNGKYLRALLIALGYYIATKKEDCYYLPLAAAYETFQTSILIHDDVIDNAELRRGKKTIHKKYEEKFDKYDLKDDTFEERKKNTSASIGICAGDIGFFIANNMIVESYMTNPNLPRVLKYYNDIVINTGKGELIDVVLPFNEQYYSKNKCLEKDIMEIYDLKTSWYTIVGPCSLGMILGGNTDRVVESIVKALSPLGTAFQIKDDILGIYGSIKSIGKSNTSDITEYKQTLLYSYVVNNTEYKDELRKYYGKDELSDRDLLKVRDIFEKSGARAYAVQKMDELFRISKSLVIKNRNIPAYYKEILLGFITYLEIREN